MNDESYYCKRCKLPFSKMQMQANEFEDQLDNQGHLQTHGGPSDENIVQLGCNPAHVFHAECIESFVFCPECFVPIEQEVPHSFLDENSDFEENPRQAGASDEEENLLNIDDTAQPTANEL